MNNQDLWFTFIFTQRSQDKFQKGKKGIGTAMEETCGNCGENEFHQCSGNLWLLIPPDSAPFQRPVGCFSLRARGPWVRVCFRGWKAIPGWPPFTHHLLSMPLTCWKTLNKNVTCLRFNVNICKRWGFAHPMMQQGCF